MNKSEGECWNACGAKMAEHDGKNGNAKVLCTQKSRREKEKRRT